MYDGSPSSNDRAALPAGPDVRLGPVVVYTAITEGYDALKEQPPAAAKEASFVAFLDAPLESATWRSLPIHSGFADPNRNAKIHKVLPHVHFPDAEYSLWIDGSITMLPAASVRHLIDTYLSDCDLAVFPHRLRTCVYQEASVCLQRRLDEPEVIWQQICRYTSEGYPADAGLAECTVVLRRHTARVTEFNEAWWEEIVRGSRRDQLSFGYVIGKLGLRYTLFPGTIADNPWFQRGLHADLERALPPLGDAAPGSSDQGAAGPRPRFYRSSSTASRRRKTIAFGRVRDKPSWAWVGFDVARALSRSYDVLLYDSNAEPPPCDVLIAVKKRPFDGFVSEALRKGTNLVYCPIDGYKQAEEVERDAEFLASCAMVMAHSERLVPVLAPYCANVQFVEHHARYALREMTPYKESGYVLWISACQYLPYLVRWLEQHPADHEIRILSDFDNENGRALARVHAQEIGIEIDISCDTTSLAGHRAYRWSERRQQEMMRDCRAAFDVKMTQFFEQYHKPPTKAQQYIASGVPFAVNPESYSAEYFRARGFDVASPLDVERWLSREYCEATRVAAERLRAATSIEAVAARYRELIESL